MYYNVTSFFLQLKHYIYAKFRPFVGHPPGVDINICIKCRLQRDKID